MRKCSTVMVLFPFRQVFIPRVQMQTAGSKKKEDWTEVSKEQLAEVELPASFEKLKEQKSYFYHGEIISDYELVFSGKSVILPILENSLCGVCRAAFNSARSPAESVSSRAARKFSSSTLDASTML